MSSVVEMVNRRVMSTMDETGDSKYEWDPEKPVEVAAAEKHFEELVGKGYQAFRVRRLGGRGERLQKFDPDAASILLVPPMVGG